MSPAPERPASALIHPTHVRYIKLGEGGRWEQECTRNGIIRLGFDTARPERFALCQAGDWDAVTASFEEDGRGTGTAKNFTGQVRVFFEDTGATLWLTFSGDRLYWGFLTSDPPQPHPDGGGTFRRVAGGWRATDLRGEPLTVDRLSGILTQFVMFRGTSCSLKDRAEAYAILRVNGQQVPEVGEALRRREELEHSVTALMRLLKPHEFELLVDLIFSSSGWQRLGIVGGTTKTLDIDLLLPSTGERAFVQVKSATTQAELNSYSRRFADLEVYDRMFFVYHTPERSLTADDERVIVIGPSKLAAMVLDAGLVNWLIRKVS